MAILTRIYGSRMGHSSAIGSCGVIVASRVIKKGEELLMNYGDDWTYWDSYKITIAKAAARMLAEVALALGIGCYRGNCRDLNRVVQEWLLDADALTAKESGQKWSRR